MTDVQPAQIVSRLEGLCRGELAAVETYNMALASACLLRFRAELLQGQRSHQTRVHLLGWRIHLLGGIPPESSGVWGVFAKALESVATVVSESAALAALEEGENHGMREYESSLQALDADTGEFVRTRLLPAQERTHEVITLIRAAVAAV